MHSKVIHTRRIALKDFPIHLEYCRWSRNQPKSWKTKNNKSSFFGFYYLKHWKFSLLVESYRILSFFRSPNCGEREPVKPLLNDKSLHVVKQIYKVNCKVFSLYLSRETDTYKDLNSVSPPMSPLNLPLRPIVDNPLCLKSVELSWRSVELIKKNEVKINYYNEVTLDLLQVTPSHGAPQGSSDLSQLGGVFFHISFKDRSTVAAHFDRAM